jgi:hypothetical protein
VWPRLSVALTPDVIPGASINCWTAAIRLFDFYLHHIPAPHHHTPDGLSRRPRALEDPEDEDPEDWLNDKLEAFYFESSPPLETTLSNETEFQLAATVTQLPSFVMFELNTKLEQVKTYLESFELPSENIKEENKAKFIRYASQFFVQEGLLYRRQKGGRHQRVLSLDDRLPVLVQAHDDLGHRGFFPVRRALLDRFWWPSMAEDIKWYLKTCHICQIRNFFQLHLPPTVSSPPRLFAKAYIDTMHMPNPTDSATLSKPAALSPHILNGMPYIKKPAGRSAHLLG